MGVDRVLFGTGNMAPGSGIAARGPGSWMEAKRLDVDYPRSVVGSETRANHSEGQPSTILQSLSQEVINSPKRLVTEPGRQHVGDLGHDALSQLEHPH